MMHFPKPSTHILACVNRWLDTSCVNGPTVVHLSAFDMSGNLDVVTRLILTYS